VKARLRLILLAVITTLSALACMLTGPTQELLVTPLIESATEALEPTATDTASRYFNTEAAISLVLPSGWGAAGPFAIDVPGQFEYDLYVLGISPSDSGGPGPSRLIVGDPSAMSLDSFAASQCGDCPKQPIEDAVLAGVPVRRTTIGGGSVPFRVEWMFLEHAGKVIGLSIHDPGTLESLQDVLQTLRLETPISLATPYAQQPAAGICAEPTGDEVVMRLEPGIPDPRCMIILTHQHLRVVNKTRAEVRIALGSYSAVLGPDGETVFENPFGAYLMPGVHALQVDPCCGGELWLKE